MGVYMETMSDRLYSGGGGQSLRSYTHWKETNLLG